MKPLVTVLCCVGLLPAAPLPRRPRRLSRWWRRSSGRMKAGDAAAMAALLHAEARLVSTSVREGVPATQVEAVGRWLAGVGASTRELDERIHDVKVHQDGGLAVVWADYDLYVDGATTTAGWTRSSSCARARGGGSSRSPTRGVRRAVAGRDPPDPGAPAVGAASRVRRASFRPTRARPARAGPPRVPVAVVQVTMMLMGTVDTVMVGRVSATDLAAVALGNLYFFGAAVFGMGVLFALDPVVSQAVGAGDPVGVARAVQRGGVLAVALTVLATLLLLPARWVFEALRQPADVVPVAAGYALACMAGVLPFYLFNVLRQSLQAMHRMGPILLTVVAANLANVFFNWVLIYGNLGMPAMGAVGSGWATSLSRWFMACLLLVLGWPVLRPSVLPLRPEALARAPLVRFLRLGAPIGAQQTLEFGVFGAAGLFMGWLGTVAMAAHQVALNLASLTFMVSVGVAQAAAVLVGNAVGREDPPGARRAAGAGLLTGAAFMACTAVIFLSAPAVFAHLYSADEAVVAVAVVLIPIAGIFQVFDGTQVVASGVLRGVGDTRVPMLVNLVGFWVVGLPVSFALGFGLDMGPRGVWFGLAAGIGAVALLLVARVRARFGRDLRRLILEDDHHAPGVGAADPLKPAP